MEPPSHEQPFASSPDEPPIRTPADRPPIQGSDHGPAGGSAAGEPTSDERTWAMLAHLAVLVFSIFGPLIIYLVKKDESEFIADQAKEALNFQLAVMIVSLLTLCTFIGPFVVWVAAIVYGVMAGLEANKGVRYRYPYTWRLIT